MVFYHRGGLGLYSFIMASPNSKPSQSALWNASPLQIRCASLGVFNNKSICTFYFLQCKFLSKSLTALLPPTADHHHHHQKISLVTSFTNLVQLGWRKGKKGDVRCGKADTSLKGLWLSWESPPSDRGKEMTSWGFTASFDSHTNPYSSACLVLARQGEKRKEKKRSSQVI